MAVILKKRLKWQRVIEYFIDNVVIFKRRTYEAHKLNYKDKFLEKNVFQWETIHDISESGEKSQKSWRQK